MNGSYLKKSNVGHGKRNNKAVVFSFPSKAVDISVQISEKSVVNKYEQ